jgi:ubiquinone/menaquinone biosynthesis C-methylase UbiE
LMSHSLCPFWMGYLLLCPFRRFGQNPDKILAPYVGSGMTVLEVGPGMGYFTLPMARMVGPTGKIVCVDTQEQMLAAVRRRAAKAGLADRVEARACPPTALNIDDLAGQVDFVLLFAVAHEVPDVARLFAEVAQAMKPGARCLLAEPRLHVTVQEFDRTLAAAAQHGLHVVDRPRIRASHTAVLSPGRL